MVLLDAGLVSSFLLVGGHLDVFALFGAVMLTAEDCSSIHGDDRRFEVQVRYMVDGQSR